MKKFTKKILAVLLSSLMVVQAAPSTVAHAAAPFVTKNVKIWLHHNKKPNTVRFTIKNPVKNGKITNIKSSKPSVAKASAGKDCLVVKLKSTGKTKITFKYAKKKLSTTITVAKWVSPCKEFKIGKKDYAKNFQKSGWYNLYNQKKNKKETIKIVPKKGWKLVKISAGEILGDWKTIKNGSKVNLSLKNGGTGIFAFFKNVKTGEQLSFCFHYSNLSLPSGNDYDHDYIIYD